MNVERKENFIMLKNMKIMCKFICLLLFSACLLMSPTISSSSATDPHPTIKIPIFQGGYKLEEHFDASNEIKSVTYRVQTDTPPTQVLEFYDAYFNGSGWRSSFETCQRNWENLADRTKTATPIARQLFASWEHAELNLTAILWLQYEMAGNERQNEVVVKCRLQPKTGK
jgi:hypothetical protein